MSHNFENPQGPKDWLPPTKTPKPEKRPAKAISIAIGASGNLFALFEDGTIWERQWVRGIDQEWFKVEPISRDTP